MTSGLAAPNTDAENSFPGRLKIATAMAGGGNALAEKTGIGRRTIAEYLSGGSEPNVSRLVAIASAAGVSVEWLATGKGEAVIEKDEPASLDEGTLEAAIQVIEEFIAERNLHPTPGQKAALVATLYSLHSDQENKCIAVTPAYVAQLFRLVSRGL